MSRAFSNGKPDLVASDITDNNKGKAIYDTLVTESAYGTNYDGYVKFENQIGTSYRSYELYQDATLGYNLCNDCSACDVPLNPFIEVPFAHYFGLNATDISANLVDVSDNAITYVDPSNNILSTPCHIKEYTDHVAIITFTPGLPAIFDPQGGNSTDFNYLNCYDFPAKVNFAPP